MESICPYLALSPNAHAFFNFFNLIFFFPYLAFSFSRCEEKFFFFASKGFFVSKFFISLVFLCAERKRSRGEKENESEREVCRVYIHVVNFFYTRSYE